MVLENRRGDHRSGNEKRSDHAGEEPSKGTVRCSSEPFGAAGAAAVQSLHFLLKFFDSVHKLVFTGHGGRLCLTLVVRLIHQHPLAT